MPDLIDRIDALLPQTQCTKCGYDGCRPYAQAIAQGLADINRCPPGGQSGVAKLAALLDRPEPLLDHSRGVPGPLLMAVIDEEHCIGCTLCIQACPVDAIVGANKYMHTVVPELCTGCDLCVAPCPVDCITMQPAEGDWTAERADKARHQHERRLTRLAPLQRGETTMAARALTTTAALGGIASDTKDAKQQRIADALARARTRRSLPKNHE